MSTLQIALFTLSLLFSLSILCMDSTGSPRMEKEQKPIRSFAQIIKARTLANDQQLKESVPIKEKIEFHAEIPSTSELIRPLKLKSEHSTQASFYKAVARSQFFLVDHYLDNDPTLVNTAYKKDGAHALDYAVAHNHPEMVVHLLKEGANPNNADNEGKAALLWVFYSKREYQVTEDDRFF